jgi:hydrogenase-4 component B
MTKKEYKNVIWALGAVLLLIAFYHLSSNTIEISHILSEGLSFSASGLSLVFAFSGTVPWLLSFFFSLPYFRAEEEHPATMEHGHPGSLSVFYVGFGLSLLATLAVFFADSLFSAFIWFEVLGLTSYLLVRHEGTQESEEASDLYHDMSTIGGLFLLAGALILKTQTNSTSYTAISKLPADALKITLFLIIAGFGVKAGIIGLHVWLPRAHPVAPSPASAVLSGVMIKVGAFGILRTLLSARNSYVGGVDLSLIIAILGLANMFWGGISALLTSNLKRVLAFSSVSQMGYILLGISQSISHGHGAELGLSGALYHVLNHGLFKSLLFLVAGYLLVEEGTTELSELRGVLRKHPWALAGFMTGSLAITGLPGLNGFISKTLIHDSLIVAAQHGESIWRVIEKGFTLGAALTALYFLRTFIILWSLPKDQSKQLKPVPSKLKGHLAHMVFVIYIILIVTIGVFPGFYMNHLIRQGLEFANIGNEGIEELETFNYFTMETIKPIALGFLLAAIAYMFLKRPINNIVPTPQYPVGKLFKMAEHGVVFLGNLLNNLAERLYYGVSTLLLSLLHLKSK